MSITGSQLKEMQEARVSLVVPRSLHSEYPKAWHSGLLDVHGFIESVKQRLSAPVE